MLALLGVFQTGPLTMNTQTGKNRNSKVELGLSRTMLCTTQNRVTFVPISGTIMQWNIVFGHA